MYEKLFQLFLLLMSDCLDVAARSLMEFPLIHLSARIPHDNRIGRQEPIPILQTLNSIHPDRMLTNPKRAGN